MATAEAKAHPEKRLFVSLLTRDISLVDAFLDLVDNSINAAIKKKNIDVTDAASFFEADENLPTEKYSIKIDFSESRVKVTDNCGGIKFSEAESEIFVFGSAEDGDHGDDSLSVYGIGLKRALFKLGNEIKIVSDHPDGGFEMNLDVPGWQSQKQDQWTFPISRRPPAEAGRTEIHVRKLHPEISQRITSPDFQTTIIQRISSAYAYFLSKIVDVSVNGETITATEVKLGENRSSEHIQIDDVSIFMVAGIGVPNNNRYEAERAGWNVYCNGRAVIYYDKSPLTGWGVDGMLPTFQPKHRPFLGMVFFSSKDPSHLPWTTTKLGVNTDNYVWQRAQRKMADVARQVIRFLDARYGEEGTSITIEDLSDTIGTPTKVTPVRLSAPVSFRPPKKTTPPTTSIQYRVDKKVLANVKESIGRRSMSNSDVGRYTFDYFIDNEM